MRQKDILLKCFRCKDEHPVLTMVMDASGNGMTCMACAGLAAGKTQKVFEPRERRRYKCMGCRYNFGSSKPKAQVACGYCGSRNIATEKQMQAERLLDDEWRPL